MANHKSAAKRARQSIKKTIQNNTVTKTVRTFERKLRTAISSKNKDEAQTLLREYMSKAGKAAKSGVVKSQNVSRKVSRLSAQVSKLA